MIWPFESSVPFRRHFPRKESRTGHNGNQQWYTSVLGPTATAVFNDFSTALQTQISLADDVKAVGSSAVEALDSDIVEVSNWGIHGINQLMREESICFQGTQIASQLHSGVVLLRKVH